MKQFIKIDHQVDRHFRSRAIFKVAGDLLHTLFMGGQDGPFTIEIVPGPNGYGYEVEVNGRQEETSPGKEDEAGSAGRGTEKGQGQKETSQSPDEGQKARTARMVRVKER